MPLTEKGKEILAKMEKEYGAEQGERVFYASANKGTITGVHDTMDQSKLDAVMSACQAYDAASNQQEISTLKKQAEMLGKKSYTAGRKVIKAERTHPVDYRNAQEEYDRITQQLDVVVAKLKKLGVKVLTGQGPDVFFDADVSKFDDVMAACDAYERKDVEKIRCLCGVNPPAYWPLSAHQSYCPLSKMPKKDIVNLLSTNEKIKYEKSKKDSVQK